MSGFSFCRALCLVHPHPRRAVFRVSSMSGSFSLVSRPCLAAASAAAARARVVVDARRAMRDGDDPQFLRRLDVCGFGR